MKNGLILRRLRYVTFSVVAVGALYSAACLHVLAHLDEFNLIAAYVLAPNSSKNPIVFPMPGWARDVYWVAFGRDRVFRKNDQGNEYVKFMNSMLSPISLPPAESLDRERAQALLTQLICAKRGNGQAMQEIKTFQKKWSSQPLGAAIQRCEQEENRVR